MKTFCKNVDSSSYCNTTSSLIFEKFWVYSNIFPGLPIYPHVHLDVCHLGSTNSALIILNSRVFSPVVFQEFCQRVKLEMTIRAFVAPLHFKLGGFSVAQFVSFHSVEWLSWSRWVYAFPPNNSFLGLVDSKVGHGWQNKPRLACFIDVYPIPMYLH